MYIELQEKCESVVKNLKVLKKTFWLDTTILQLSAAMYLTNKKILADQEELKRCNAIIKKHCGALSVYRNNMRDILCVRMMTHENPEDYLLKIMELSDLVDRRKALKTAFAVHAAILLYDRVDPSEYEYYAGLTKVIYQRMKEEHRFLTGEDDLAFAALLAVSNIDIENLDLEMKECFELLKEEKISLDARQELSHILALDMGAPTEKVAKVKALFEEFKRRKKQFRSGYEMVSVGMLAMIDLSVSELCDMVLEIEEWLKPQEGFHGLSVDRAGRLMCASDFVVETYRPEGYEMDSVLQYISLKVAIAQQAAAAAAAA